MRYWGDFRPYVSVSQRRANAAREMQKLAKKGRVLLPVQLAGRKITTTFWGTAWSENLEQYSDFENRLPRGRTYVRNGSVVHLQIETGKVTAIVSGTNLYNVTIDIKPLASKAWSGIKSQCGGQIGSLVELLAGKLSKNVMEIVTHASDGLFPQPDEIKIRCSCPDWAGLCKHAAATLYGVGARLDEQPEFLFLLRQVDHLELVEEAVAESVVGKAKSGKRKIATNDLADVFGIELAEPAPEAQATDEADNAAAPQRAATKRRAANGGPTEKAPGRRKPRPASGANGNVKTKSNNKANSRNAKSNKASTTKPKSRAAVKSTGKPAAKTTAKSAGKSHRTTK